MVEIAELRQLEERVKGLMDRCRDLSQENRRLGEELEESRRKVAELEAQVRELMEERSSVKERVASLITLIDGAGLGNALESTGSIPGGAQDLSYSEGSSVEGKAPLFLGGNDQEA